jgi:ferrochelatase
MRKIAVVLFNLGGPDQPASVRPFLFNLFNDPAIIGVPAPLRFLLAKFIAWRRGPKAEAIYAKLGGGSPLLANTEAQAHGLEAALAPLGRVRVFIAMRYWRPMSDETARRVAEFAPDDLVLLPLYPQFSTTTTASSRRDWDRAARRAAITPASRTVCCYPDDRGFVRALADLIRPAHARASHHGRPRVLFSAHGLPKRVIERGDPYRWQIERTADAVVSELGTDLDWAICYQSRVGPLEWIGPSTEEEIERAGRERVPAVVVPVAFVSEHSETLVELDIEYRERAKQAGVPHYERVPAVATHPAFIAGLADLVRGALERTPSTCSGVGARLCPASRTGCAMAG